MYDHESAEHCRAVAVLAVVSRLAAQCTGWRVLLRIQEGPAAQDLLSHPTPAIPTWPAVNAYPSDVAGGAPFQDAAKRRRSGAGLVGRISGGLRQNGAFLASGVKLGFRRSDKGPEPCVSPSRSCLVTSCGRTRLLRPVSCRCHRRA